MTVLVDAAQVPAHGRFWSHLASDVSAEELHRFAARLAVPRRAFEGDHYDIPSDLVERAVDLGAEFVTTRELLRRLRAAGLRTPKRRGEKVVSTAVVDGQRVDVVRSSRVPSPHGEHLLLRSGAAEVVEGAVPAGRVLGFRRRWVRGPRGFDLRHDGVVMAGVVSAGEVLDGGAGEWWSALLAPEE